jgi:hypothetical protein
MISDPISIFLVVMITILVLIAISSNNDDNNGKFPGKSIQKSW